MVGKAIKRVEDRRLITGKGRYLDDVKLAGTAHIAILRTPYAHANITSVDTSSAQTMPGVVDVFTGEDMPVNPLPMRLAGRRLADPEQRQHPARARGRRRPQVGDGVAVGRRGGPRVGGRRAAMRSSSQL